MSVLPVESRYSGAPALEEQAGARQKAGLPDARRIVRLIRQTISSLRLDLSGLTVLTEAASGPYVVTPIIAALAGARRVIALTRDSHYASADAVVAQTRALASLAEMPDVLEIHRVRSPDLFAQADIVTNLGFVRPIDAAAAGAMKATAVIPLMCEAWEFRPGDIDLDACGSKGILVLGTDEDHPLVDVFSYSGWLALKLLFEAAIEIHNSRILVVGSDKFGVVIEERLRRAGANVRLVADLRDYPHDDFAPLDALIVCDYTREDCIIGPGGDITVGELAAAASVIRVILFAGRIDLSGLRSNGIVVYPGEPLPPHRMARTLGALGPRPVIELHAAGLKVGEAAARVRKTIMDATEAYEAIRRSCPFAQLVRREVVRDG